MNIEELTQKFNEKQESNQQFKNNVEQQDFNCVVKFYKEFMKNQSNLEVVGSEMRFKTPVFHECTAFSYIVLSDKCKNNTLSETIKDVTCPSIRFKRFNPDHLFSRKMTWFAMPTYCFSINCLEKYKNDRFTPVFYESDIMKNIVNNDKK